MRIGCLGAGGRGGISRLAHRPQEGIELVAICDKRPEVQEEYRKTIPEVSFYTDYRKLLAEAKVDAVFVATPDFLHEEMTVAALQRGIGVFVEKPMAITIEGCDRMIAAAAASGAKLYVGHNMRFFPVMRKMREIIESGRIGNVQAVWCRHFIAYGGDAYFKDWHSEQRFGTGLLLQKGAHDIDIIHYLAGSHTVRTVGMGMLSVYNRVKDRRAPGDPGDATFKSTMWPPLTQTALSPIIDVEDHSMVLMQLANGMQASYEQCHYTPDSQRNYTVIGDAGRIENFGDRSTGDQEAIIRIWDRRVGYVEHGCESIAIPHIAGGHGGADPTMVEDFLRYLKTGERKGATPEDARAAVAAGYLASQSMRHGNQPYDVPKPARS